jgi:EpsI family protein
MFVFMPEPRLIIVPVLLLGQLFLVRWAAGGERPPAPPVLSSVPFEFREWRHMQEVPIAADIAGELRADQLLSRTYAHAPSGSVADLFVAWFQSQRAGTSQPHSPKVCLPAVGWMPALTGTITLDTTAGAITVNRYIVVKGGQRNVVLYWYQGPRRVTAGEWEAKLWLMADALRYNRTDTALVRVVVPSIHGDDEKATGAAASFAQNLYPLLRVNLPR